MKSGVESTKAACAPCLLIAENAVSKSAAEAAA
jgi:hypothetical protein